VEAQFSFCDISIAGTLRPNARNELDLIVEKSNSYLGLWKEYNNIETQNILHKVQQFGWVRYDHHQILPNGDRRFHLLREDNLEEKLKMLFVDAEAFCMEASEHQPQVDTIEGRKSKSQSFYGQIENVDLYNLQIELRPANLDDNLSPPTKGFLFISLQGDITRLPRRQMAETLIRTATCP